MMQSGLANNQNAQNTTLSQVQQVLRDSGAAAMKIRNNADQSSYDKAMLLKTLTKFNENDPAQMRLLDEVLDSLNFKNGQAQKVDG